MRKKFFIGDETELYLFDTSVENIFISEYMVAAPAEYVKVYLFALMYAKADYYMDNEALARQLSMEIEDVLKAWSYWEKLGIVSKHFDNEKSRFDYSIEFLSLREQMFCAKKPNTESKVSGALEDVNVSKLLKNIEKKVNRPLSPNEPAEIISLIDDLAASPELIMCGYNYCVKIGHTEIKYITKTLRNWIEKGFKTEEDVQNYLQEMEQRYFTYKRVMKALGFHRNASEEEQRKIDYWMDTLEFNLDKILEACARTSGIPNPNINYVNGVIENWAKESGKKVVEKEKSKPKRKMVTATGVQKYYEHIRSEAENEAQKRQEEVYASIPRVRQIDEEMRDLGIKQSQMLILKTSDAKKQVEKVQNEMMELLGEKAYLMAESNFDIEYMEVKYKCNMCKDTGIDENGMRCSCYEQRLREANIWQNP